MNDDRTRIDAYLDAFASSMVGPHSSKDRARAELVEHLTDAAAARELDEALERLGPPEAAAASFAGEARVAPAPMDDRIVAAVIDNLPLIGLTIALLVQQVMHGADTINITFPPAAYVLVGGACISPVPILFGQCEAYARGALYVIGMPLVLLWSIVGLGVLESRFGTTPGKRLVGMWVTSEAGTRISPSAGIVRRLSFLAGPLAWLDWTPLLWGDRRRVCERIVETRVVTIDATERAQSSSGRAKTTAE